MGVKLILKGLAGASPFASAFEDKTGNQTHCENNVTFR
jgi:hypothetical protein